MFIKSIYKGKYFKLGEKWQAMCKNIKTKQRAKHDIGPRPTVQPSHKIPWFDHYIVSGTELRDQGQAALAAEKAERNNTYDMEKTIEFKTALVAGLVIKVNKLADRLRRYEG